MFDTNPKSVPVKLDPEIERDFNESVRHNRN
jgi:hypothetical protein